MNRFATGGIVRGLVVLGMSSLALIASAASSTSSSGSAASSSASDTTVYGYLPPPQVVCTEDRMKFCKDVEPGYQRVEQCLWKHIGEVVPACRIYLQQKADAKRAAGRENEVEPMAE